MLKPTGVAREHAGHLNYSVSRPLYLPGTIRMRRWRGQGDVRAYRPPEGWTAAANLIDIHPVSGQPLPDSQWWLFETKQ